MVRKKGSLSINTRNTRRRLQSKDLSRLYHLSIYTYLYISTYPALLSIYLSIFSRHSLSKTRRACEVCGLGTSVEEVGGTSEEKKSTSARERERERRLSFSGVMLSVVSLRFLFCMPLPLIHGCRKTSSLFTPT